MEPRAQANRLKRDRPVSTFIRLIFFQTVADPIATTAHGPTPGKKGEKRAESCS